MRASYLALTCVLVASTFLHAQQQPQAPAPTKLDPARNRLDALLLQWEEKMKAIETLSAKITRVREDKVNRTREVYEGEAKYRRPSLAILDLRRKDKPAVFEKYIITDAYFYEYDRIQKEIRIHSLPPPKSGQATDDNILSFLFDMKAEDAIRKYDIILKQSDDYWIYFEIRPRSPEDKKDFQLAKLALAQKTFLPGALVFEEPNGNTTRWDIKDIKTNVLIDRNEFVAPTLPPDWHWKRVPLKQTTEVPPRVVRPKP